MRAVAQLFCYKVESTLALKVYHTPMHRIPYPRPRRKVFSSPVKRQGPSVTYPKHIPVSVGCCVVLPPMAST